MIATFLDTENEVPVIYSYMTSFKGSGHSLAIKFMNNSQRNSNWHFSFFPWELASNVPNFLNNNDFLCLSSWSWIVASHANFPKNARVGSYMNCKEKVVSKNHCYLRGSICTCWCNWGVCISLRISNKVFSTSSLLLSPAWVSKH